MNQSVQAAPGVDFHERISGGRGSTAAQRTNRERAPQHAAGKVPVLWDRKCHWETSRPASKLAVKLRWSCTASRLATCNSTVMP